MDDKEINATLAFLQQELRLEQKKWSSGPDGKDLTKGAMLSVQRALRTISWVLRFLVAGSSRFVSTFHPLHPAKHFVKYFAFVRFLAARIFMAFAFHIE